MRRFAPLAAAALLLAACTPPPPVDLSDSFSPPSGWAARGRAAHPECRVTLGAINDLRADPHVIGNIGFRMIHAADVPAWVRSGIQSLSSHAGIEFVPSGGLGLDVDIVKAYVQSQAVNKAATIVLRIRFATAGGTPEERVYRGEDNALNWSQGVDETQGTFDRAMAQLLEQLAPDILARCPKV